MRRPSLKTLSLIVLLAAVLPVSGARPLARQVAVGPWLVAQQATVGGYIKVSETRVGLTLFEYIYRATLSSPFALTGATASAVSLVAATTIVDGSVTFGPVAAGGSVVSSDTFTFRHDRTVPFDFANLLWTVQPSANQPPIANAGADQLIPGKGSLVTLDGTASFDPEGTAVTYAWELIGVPSGSASTLLDPTAAHPTFVPDQKGTYTARLVVSDGVNFSNPDTVQVVVQNTAPIANAGADFSRSVGQTAQLNGGASSDADGDPLTFSWSFLTTPSGSASVLSNPTSVNPSFLVDKPGAYLVQLIVNDGTVGSAADTVTVTILNSPPVANAGPDQSGSVGGLVTLDGSASSDVDGDPITFTWSFQSKPATSAAVISNPGAVQPTFTIDVAGQYVVRLVVNDGFVNSAPDTMTVSTSNSPPVANAGPDQTVFVTNLVTLNGSASSDADGNLLTFAWSFVSKPAGSAAVLSNPSAVNPTFVVDKPGSYTARLVVNDGFVTSAPDLVVITTQNSPPVANAGTDQSKLVTQTVTLDGSASIDVDGDPLTYLWSLTSAPAGSTAALDNPAAVMPTFTIDRPGSYVAQLIVNDGLVMSAADTVTISTVNSPPVSNAGPDKSVVAGQAVALNGQGSSDVDGDPLSFAWSFTNVPPGSTAVLQNPTSVSPTFTADRPGQYVVQLIVNDGFVNGAPDTVTIATTNLPPTANAGPDQINVPVGSGVTVDGSLSSDPDSHPLSFFWSLTSKPAGSTAVLSGANSVSTGFTADRFGDYVLQLIVNDGFVNSPPDTVTIRTANRPPTAHAGPDQNVTTGALVTLDGSLSVDPDGQVITKQWAFTSVPPGSAAILAGATTNHPTFTPDVDGAYAVALTVTDSLGLSATDSVSIVASSAPAPVVVTVAATDANASEPGANAGAFTFTRTGATTASLQVFFAVGGTATSGTDYVALPASIAIPIGQSSATLILTPVDNQLFEVNESVNVTLNANANYGIGNPNSASVTIADNDVPVVSISAFDANASEVALDTGVVRFSRNGDTSLPLTIDFTVGGSATSGDDFTAVGTSITFPAAQATVDLTITPVADPLAEGPETVIVTVVDGVAYNLGGSPSATVTIADAAPVVTVQATDAQAAEDGPDTGTFTFSRTGSTTAALTVNFTRNGTATAVDDYVDFALSVTIPIGQATATVTVTPVLDPQAETTETVQLTLASGAYAVGAPNIASIQIADSTIPLVSVQASDSNASEPGANTGTFTFSRTGSTAALLTVTYTVNGTATSGTDYTAIGTTVTFAAGNATATKTVTVLNDGSVEGNETVLVALVDLAAYNLVNPTTATVTIADNPIPVVTIAALDPNAAETGADTGTFRFTRVSDTAFDLAVTYSVTGTANNTTDYQTITTTITIPAGQTTADRIITPIADGAPESSETVILTVTDGAQYNLGTPSAATVTITDGLPVVTIVATDASATEGADTGVFTVTRTGSTTNPLVVPFSTSGSATLTTDYTLNPSTQVTIGAGQASATATLTALSDGSADTGEVATLTLTPNAAYTVGTPGSANVTITDSTPTITVAATDATATEGVDTGTFTFTRAGGNLTAALTVNVTVSGTATNNTDYTLGGIQFGTQVVFAASATTAVVTLTAIQDVPLDNSETSTITIAAGAYAIGNPSAATVTIVDTPAPVITLTATDASAAEGSDTGIYTFTRTGGNISQPLAVLYTASGTATLNTDYTLAGPDFNGQITFAGGAATKTVTLTAAQDVSSDVGETAVLTLAAGPSTGSGVYAIGSPSSGTVTISDTSPPTISIAATDPSATEGADTGTYTFTRTGGNQAAALAVAYTWSGTATLNTDYTLAGPDFNGQITFAAGQSTKVVTLTATQDVPLDNSETATLTIAAGPASGPGVYTIAAAPNNAATITITENAPPVVSLAATDPSATEGADTGTYTFTRTGGNQAAALAVAYTWSGTATLNTDYTLAGPDFNGQITFAAGQSTKVVTLTATQDVPLDNSETATLTIAAGPGSGSGVYTIAPAPNNAATITIAENTPPVISIAATDPSATEGADTGTYTFTRTGGNQAAALAVAYTWSGTATLNIDYTLAGQDFTGQITFAAGQSTKVVTLTAIQDVPLDNGETATLTIAAGPGSGSGVYTIAPAPNNAATITIVDNAPPVISIAATDPSATEGADTGTYTFTRTGGNQAAALAVAYTWSGTATLNIDYTLAGQDFTGQITFAAGQSTKVVTLTAIQDVPLDNGETATLTIAAGPGSGSGVYTIAPAPNNAATITIVDNAPPVISIAATDPSATEGADTGTYTFTRTGGNQAAALAVAYTWSGTATLNIDYTLAGQDFTGQITFAAGQSTKVVTLTAIQDVPLDNGETATLTITAGPGSGSGVYTIAPAPNNAATITIVDNAPPVISIAATDPSATEGADTGTYTFTRTGGNQAAALAVAYTWSGTATLNIDYTLAGQDFTGQITFTAGQSTKVVTLTAIQDVPLDNGETATLAITAGPGSGSGVYTIAAAPNNAATITILP